MIGSNDHVGEFMPLQVLVPIVVSTIREYNARLGEVISLLKNKTLPEELRTQYKEKLTRMLDSKYKLIYTMMDLSYDIKDSVTYTDEIKELLGSEFYSKIKRT